MSDLKNKLPFIFIDLSMHSVILLISVFCSLLLFQLLSAEWKDEKDSSESSSEPSTEDTSDQQDTDFSDSGGDTSVAVTGDKSSDVDDSVESLGKAVTDSDGFEEEEDGRPESVVTDLETCKDFVQDLANQVQAMQEALRKSKEDLDVCLGDSNELRDPSASDEDYLAMTPSVNEQESIVDDGGYETPIGGPPMVLINGDRQSQSDYEEVSDMSEPSERSPQSNGYQSDTYINISTYEMTDSLPGSTNNVKDPGPKVGEESGDDGAIYEFPPESNGEKTEYQDKEVSLAEKSEEEPKAEFRYDGPLVFDEDDKREVFKVKEKDKVKKWNPVSLKGMYDSDDSRGFLAFKKIALEQLPILIARCFPEGSSYRQKACNVFYDCIYSKALLTKWMEL